jgi:hypothetical protein
MPIIDLKLQVAQVTRRGYFGHTLSRNETLAGIIPGAVKNSRGFISRGSIIYRDLAV